MCYQDIIIFARSHSQIFLSLATQLLARVASTIVLTVRYPLSYAWA